MQRGAKINFRHRFPKRPSNARRIGPGLRKIRLEDLPRYGHSHPHCDGTLRKSPWRPLQQEFMGYIVKPFVIGEESQLYDMHPMIASDMIAKQIAEII